MATDKPSRRVVWLAPRTVSVERFEPRPPKADEVLIETEITLISPGTERAFLLGLDNAKTEFPTAGGYSLVGRVIEAGGDARNLAVGTRVVCSASHTSHATAQARRCVAVPDGVSSDEAAFFNLLAIAMQGVRKARVELGETGVVFGCGLIGNLAMQLAKLSGAFVISADMNESRRKLAERCGADASFDPKSADFDANVKQLGIGPNAPQVLIEATGFPDAILTAMRVAGWMARVVLLGSTRGVTEEVNFYRDVHKKGLILYGAHAGTIPAQDSSPGEWTWDANVKILLELIRCGRLQLQPLITHRLPAEDASSIYGEILQWNPNVLGALLEW